MKEYEVKERIICSKLSMTEKVVLLAITLRLNWNTWNGQVSAIHIAEMINSSERTVQRAMSSLVKKEIISRQSERLNRTQSAAAFTQLHYDNIDTLSNMTHDKSDVLTTTDMTYSLRQNCHNNYDKSDVRNNSNNINTINDQLEKPRFTIHEDGFRWGVGTQYPDFDPNRDYKH